MGIILINIDNITQFYVLKNSINTLDTCINNNNIADKVNKFINNEKFLKIYKNNNKNNNSLITIIDEENINDKVVIAIIAKYNDNYIIQINNKFYKDNKDILEIKIIDNPNIVEELKKILNQ